MSSLELIQLQCLHIDIYLGYIIMWTILYPDQDGSINILMNEVDCYQGLHGYSKNVLLFHA